MNVVFLRHLGLAYCWLLHPGSSLDFLPPGIDHMSVILVISHRCYDLYLCLYVSHLDIASEHLFPYIMPRWIQRRHNFVTFIFGGADVPLSPRATRMTLDYQNYTTYSH